MWTTLGLARSSPYHDAKTTDSVAYGDAVLSNSGIGPDRLGATPR